jgi:transcriptional regulator with XRE-family HTH domain
MEPHGRFGHLFAAAVEQKNLSLRDVAAKFDYSYEQMRKLVQGRSRPSKCLLTGLCDLLEMPYEEASRAATLIGWKSDTGSKRHTPRSNRTLGLQILNPIYLN